MPANSDLYAQLHDAVEGLDTAMSLWDADLRFIFANRLYSKTLFSGIATPHSGAQLKEIISLQLDNGLFALPANLTVSEFEARLYNFIQSCHSDFRLKLASGAILNAAAQRTASGSYVLTLRDITGEVRAQEEASNQRAKTHRANTRLRDALESIDECFALFDKNDQLILANESYKRVNPSSAHLMTIGRSRRELIQAMMAAGDLLDIDDWLQQYDSEVASGQTMSALRYEIEHSDGRVFLVSRRPTAEGGCSMTASDITSSKEAESEARMLLQDAIEALDDGLALFDAEINFLFCNQRYSDLVFGGSEHTPAPGTAAEKITADLYENGQFVIPQGVGRDDFTKGLLAAARSLTKGIRLTRVDGVEITSDCHQTKLGGILVTATDITQHLQMEAEIAQQREQSHQNEKLSAMGELLAGVAHELNNPLSIVVGYSMMLQNSIKENSARQQVEYIAQAAERCSKIVKAFLAMARQRPTQLKRCSLNEIVLAAIDIAGHRLRTSGVEVVLKLDTDIPEVNADDDQIIQVFVNLLVNAEQAMNDWADPSRITIQTGLDIETERVYATVNDNGPGINKDKLPRIFEPFFTTKSAGNGTGIGLAFSHRVVASHGGTMSARSDPGNGAEFRVELQIAEKDQSLTDSTEQKQFSGKGDILIVDDEPIVAELIGDILSPAGYQTTILHNAEQALKLLQQRSFDMIISDMKMPGMDGKAFFEALGAIDSNLCNRTVFVTGDTLSDSVNHFLTQSKRPFLEKPITPDELLALMASIFDQSP